MNFIKTSILNDVEKQINKITQMMPVIYDGTNMTEVIDACFMKEKLELVLPIKKIKDFLSFEEAVIASEDKKKALVIIIK